MRICNCGYRTKNNKSFSNHIRYGCNGFVNVNGYRYILKGNKKMLEHRVAMENYMGRALRRSEVVHHKNQIKIDNRIENLEVMSRKNHTRHHHLGIPMAEKTKVRLSAILMGHLMPARVRKKIAKTMIGKKRGHYKTNGNIKYLSCQMCGAKHKSLGLCQTHYDYNRRHLCVL